LPRLTTQEFKALMEQLAHAWSEQDSDAGLSCFTEDALYMEPPDIQLFLGHGHLRPYFAALTPGTHMRFHNLWFDEATQVGAGEYTFGHEGRPTAIHGVTIVEIQDGRIAFWREYQREGPSPFEEFIRAEGKDWQWHRAITHERHKSA
jgi:ketosteroid isomerase-like protein